MPATQRSPVARYAVTAAILLAVVGFVVGLFVMSQAGQQPNTPLPPANNAAQTQDQSQDQAQGQPQGQPQGDADGASTDPAADLAADDDRPTTPAPEASPQNQQAPPAETDPAAAQPVGEQPAEAPAASPATRYRARVWEDLPDPTPIGSLDPALARSRITFSLAGAGVYSVQLAEHFETVEDSIAGRANPGAADGHYELQPSATMQGLALISLAALQLEIDGQAVSLFTAEGKPVWRETAPGAFEAEVLDDDTGQPALRITRQYTLRAGSYGFDVRQRIANLTDREISCLWRQYGPVELHEDNSGYRIPTRRVRFGYLHEPARDPSQQFVVADSELTERSAVLKKIQRSMLRSASLWPDQNKFERAGGLVWTGQTSRYFCFLAHPLIDEDRAAANVADPAASPIDKRLGMTESVHALALGPDNDGEFHIVVQLDSPAFTVAPGGTRSLDFAAYAGPLSRAELNRQDEPTFRAVNLASVVIYQLGMCGFCTFQWIANLLLAMLQFFHDYIVFDWALSIILLVVCVRTALHPIFKKSQISMMRFSRQMQKLAPKQKKLQERYKDDPQRLRQEMAKLMREENVNFAGLLGCLPMLLQSPIWFALYAMIYFVFELRHEPAFFGVIQTLTGNNWLFLADLSRPDGFIPIGGPHHVPFLSTLMGDFAGINILPLLMGFVFYVHQKFLTPPTAATLSPEQQQQQKIIKVMMVVMFPVFMYNAPAGLTLYFITNSSLAIVEGRYIRSHVDKMDLDEPPKPKHKQLGRKKVANEARQISPFKKDRDRGPKNRFKDRR